MASPDSGFVVVRTATRLNSDDDSSSFVAKLLFSGSSPTRQIRGGEGRDECYREGI